MNNSAYRWTTIILTILTSVALTVGLVKTFDTKDLTYLTYAKEVSAWPLLLEDQEITKVDYNTDTNVFVVEGANEMWTTYHTIRARNKWYGRVLGFWVISAFISMFTVALPLSIYFETRAYSQKARQNA